MAKIVAQGQMTIVDMYDMPPVQGRLTSNQPKMVVLNSAGTAQSPDWSTTNLVIQAELYKAGDANDLVNAGNASIKGITWYYTLGTAAETSTAPSGVIVGRSATSQHDNKITINQKLLSVSVPSLKIRAVISYDYVGTTTQNVPVSVEIDFALVNNGVAGQDSYSAFLNNTSAVIPCTSAGANSAATSVITQAFVYKGGVSGSVALSIVPKGGVGTLPTGVTITQSGTNGVSINFASGSTMATESGIITLLATCDAKVFEVVFSWSKGRNGIDSNSYWLQSSTSAIIKKWNGSAWVYDPTSISVSAKTQTGTGTATGYNGRFKIQLYNGATAGTSVTSTVDEASRALTIPAETVTHAIVTLYRAGGTATILDEEKIMVIEEPKKTISTSVYAESDTIRNSSGSATLKVVVYRDGVNATASATKAWYKGGTSLGNSTDTLVVTGADVLTSQMYSCQVTIDGATYTDSIVIYDTSDPIQGSVQSTNGEVFKNGTGSTQLTFKLWRNGAPLDETGTVYGYCWHKYAQTGIEDTNWEATAVTAAALATAGPSMALTTGAVSGSTITVDDITYLTKGTNVFLGSNTVAYRISAVDAPTKKLTFTVAPTTTAIGSTVRIANYKSITVSNTEVDEKATFLCELVE